jgi:uncharacterized repeat protein (TIGR01451 family)
MTGNFLTAALAPARRRSRATAMLSALGLLAASLASAPFAEAAAPGPDVGISKHAVQDGSFTTRVEAGSTFRYRIVVWNHGQLPANNVTVKDDLDDNLIIESTFVEVNSTKPPPAHPCDVAPGNVLTCELGTLEKENDNPGGTEDSGYVRIVVTAPETPCGGTVTNQAHVTADDELIRRLTDNTSRLVSVDVHCPDVIAPTISQPVTTFWRGTRLQTAKVPVRTSWSASDNDSGISRFRLQHRVDGGVWKNVALSRPRVRHATLWLASRHTHQVRLRAEDVAGNWSTWRRGSAFGLRAHQETSKAISYSQAWRLRSLTGSYGGEVERSGRAGARATFTFTGRGVAWVATMGRRGSATVFVDGVEVRTVDLSRATSRTRVVVWRMNWSTVDSHVVRIVVAGTAGHPLVDIDAFLVQN